MKYPIDLEENLDTVRPEIRQDPILLEIIQTTNRMINDAFYNGFCLGTCKTKEGYERFIQEDRQTLACLANARWKCLAYGLEGLNGTRETKEVFSMKNQAYFLPDEQVRDLSEATPLTEGGTIEDFISEAAVVKSAIERAAPELPADQFPAVLRAVLLMRGLYLLGVQRGGEAYRSLLELQEDLKAEIPDSMTFDLSDSCMELWASDLARYSRAELRELLEVLGLWEI